MPSLQPSSALPNFVFGVRRSLPTAHPTELFGHYFEMAIFLRQNQHVSKDAYLIDYLR
jgi:hypothetical protein